MALVAATHVGEQWQSMAAASSCMATRRQSPILAVSRARPGSCRWTIEGDIRHLKSPPQLENPSGRSDRESNRHQDLELFDLLELQARSATARTALLLGGDGTRTNGLG